MASSTHHDHSLTGQSLKKVSLDRLMRFGTPPLSPSKLIESAELTRQELIQRIQRRVNAHLSLPYLPASNPHIKQVMSIYRRSFEEINSLPPIRTVEDNAALLQALVTMVDDATDVIGMFATGFKESKRYLSEEQISSFLNRAIQSRISIRLIAEQHLSLSKAEHSPSPSRTGIVDKKMNLKKTLESVLQFAAELCEGTFGIAPEWRLSGEVEAEVCFVEMHVSWYRVNVFSTLLSALRATVEHHREVTKTTNPPLPPIEVAVAVERPPRVTVNSKETTDRSLSDAEISKSILCIRIRDHGGGIDPQDLPRVFSYAFSTVGSEDNAKDGMHNQADFDRISYGQEELKSSLGRIAGLGFGLPMARLYCRYFGGNLELVNMHGVGGGVDSYITIGVGT
ncbi:uncharacterized protein PGTG_06884 [Puccinia graminis f. sp. tritici CRL 75-36-700-3]|uniref:Protein-serine/threonine kinase n=1 Tax=Puccinia graminis f. sp. tritici (strain CRL 75-36-700-3 / race SCCL) TaxID=418459 RepID=E3KAA6_PUCGT|nr:uncharacterized protein PGTG_06884 [Puccinia graminis f. sp. tritici CRL 75-36-700-3]EFP81263.2 hypothetical protein PGTG_06884 [Puccinia graminis f. sp. tritici CRL 75-36-700-3]